MVIDRKTFLEIVDIISELKQYEEVKDLTIMDTANRICSLIEDKFDSQPQIQTQPVKQVNQQAPVGVIKAYNQQEQAQQTQAVISDEIVVKSVTKEENIRGTKVDSKILAINADLQKVAKLRGER